MVRMSDLVRGMARPGAPGPPSPAPAPPPAAPREDAPAPPPAPAAPESRLRIGPLTEPTPAPAPAPTPDVDAAQEAEDLFAQLHGFIARARELTRGAEPFPWVALGGHVDRVVASLDAGGALFWEAHRPVLPPGVDWVSYHQARVAVLALRVAVAAGYDRARLGALGLAGCLFDIGLWQLPDGLLRHHDALSGEELAQYRAHPRQGAQIVRRWGPPQDGLVEAIQQHHEREQGQGFPQGAAGAGIHPDAKLLGLLDTYASMTLPASGAPGVPPHEAVRELVRSKNDFPPALVKALLGELSVFPPGTMVRLNTGETGCVVAVNRNHPLRPRVEVYDAKGPRQGAPKIVDLSEAPFLYITGPVSESAR